ncbi:MAG: F0F1 ATP synthase subunit gamma [Alphaproteobacteria bacterium]|nr:F0F1 ATP synthase subunit gamma [Alphaproteobacteria bacterium]
MPSLKDLKNRISSVKSTRKITSAMKMVAGSKLRRAQEKAESARPYERRMSRMLSSLASSLAESKTPVPRLIAGTGKDEEVLIVAITSDRGLCGAFNSNVVRETRRMIHQHESQNKKVSLICVGRKGRDILRKDFASKILFSIENLGRKGGMSFSEGSELNDKILALFNDGKFDSCYIVYNRFKSVISQIVTIKQLIPFAIETEADGAKIEPLIGLKFEPNQKAILESLLPKALAVTLYGTLLESMAGAQAAQMTAMDNATRNAGDMINKLTLNYNRSRQAFITKELIEIISGAEAV